MQIEKVEVLLSQWKGRAAILLNAEWDYSSIPNQHRAFANSFESVYSFLPLDIKVSSANAPHKNCIQPHTLYKVLLVMTCKYDCSHADTSLCNVASQCWSIKKCVSGMLCSVEVQALAHCVT